MLKAAKRRGISWRMPGLMLAVLFLPAGWPYARAAPWPDDPGPHADALVPVRRPLDATENILILGSDQRAGDPTWRTDTLTIVAVDSARGQVGLLSIPRDLYDEIPGTVQDRIDTADEYGQGSHYPGGARHSSAPSSCRRWESRRSTTSASVCRSWPSSSTTWAASTSHWMRH